MVKTATIIHGGEAGDSRRAVERENIPSGKKRFTHPVPLAILAIMIFLAAAMWSQAALARDGFEKIAATGSPISAVKDVTVKSNQSQVVWYRSNWWGVFQKNADKNPWYIYKYTGSSWEEGPFTGIEGGEGADMHVDENDGILYVLVSSKDRVARFTYSGGNWELDPGFPVAVTISPDPGSASDDPACITQASNGYVFIFWISNDIYGLYSTDQGVTWRGPFSIASISDHGLTDAIAFRYNSKNHIGLFVGKNNGTEFLFFRLEDGKDPAASSNWVQETLPISNNSDNHVNIVKDSDNNLYMIGKWGSANRFRLYKRKNNGDWSYYNVLTTGGTRPSLSIDESNNNLIILGTVSSKIQYFVMDKDNLHDVGNTGWGMALEDGSDVFNDATVSYQIVNETSNLMVCASNDTENNVWYNLLDVNDITLPVFLASFQAIPADNQINLEWATYSEVDNWEWIVFRQEGEGEEFRELTRLPGNGSTNTTSYYSFSDTDVEPEVVYAYRLANVDFNGQVNYYPEIVRTSLTPAVTFRLYNNYPNPFNAETNISFEIGERSHTQLAVYDISGRLVRSLFDGYLEPGSYVYKWDGKDERETGVASGVYILNFSSGTYRQSLKMVLSR